MGTLIKGSYRFGEMVVSQFSFILEEANVVYIDKETKAASYVSLTISYTS